MRPKKESSLVSGNRLGENFSITRQCVSEYIFSIKKKTRIQKAKETKDEMRISVENLTGFDDIVYEFALCSFNLLN